MIRPGSRGGRIISHGLIVRICARNKWLQRGRISGRAQCCGGDE